MLAEKMMERTEEQSEYGDAYRVPMDELLNLLDTLVLGIVLPPTVVNAINRKVEQYYLSEEYVFRVARERKESERKKIEADGISEFQRIVSQGISDSYLRWRGIEATLQLAQSPELQDRRDRQQQGWHADHPGERGFAGRDFAAPDRPDQVQ